VTHTICSAHVSLAKLRPLLTHYPFPEEALVLLECMPEHIVTKQKERQDLLWFSTFDQFIRFEQAIPLESYTSGRVFQDSGELRWEKDQNGFQVVYVGYEGNFSTQVVATLRDYSTNNDVSFPLIGKLGSKERKYYLFGTRLGKDDLEEIGPRAQLGDFAEARIHRLLRYPSLKKNYNGPLHFTIEELFEEETGQRVLFRFVKLDGEEASEASKEAKKA
jgi:hypothetical protein